MGTENKNDVPPVEPGQLITANCMNRILQRVREMQERVSTLEEKISSPDEPAPDTVEITGHSPREVRVGQQLTLSGKNFAVPGEANAITVGGVSVPDANVGSGSDETSLLFTVPAIDGLGDTGSDVDVVVSNAIGSARRTVRVRPESVAPDERIDVQYTAEPLTETGRIVGGQIYRFTFRTTAFTTEPGDYRATVTTGAGWEARIEGTSGDRSSLRFSLPSRPQEGATKEITVTVAVPEQGSGGTDLTLEVTETSGTTVGGGKETVRLEIGAGPPTFEKRVAAFVPENSGLKNGVLVVDGEGYVSLEFRCFVGGEWSYNARLEDPTGWGINHTGGRFQPEGDPDSEDGARFVMTHTLTERENAQATNLVVSVTKDDADPPIDADFLLPVASAQEGVLTSDDGG